MNAWLKLMLYPRVPLHRRRRFDPNGVGGLLSLTRRWQMAGRSEAVPEVTE